MPDIRQILRESNFYKASDQIEEMKSEHSKGRERPAERMNIRSQVPSQMRHEQKCEASSDDTDADEDAEDSEEAEARKARVDKALSMA